MLSNITINLKDSRDAKKYAKKNVLQQEALKK